MNSHFPLLLSNSYDSVACVGFSKTECCVFVCAFERHSVVHFNRTVLNHIDYCCCPPLAPAGWLAHCPVGTATGIEHHGGLEEPLAPASFVWPELAHSQHIQNGSQAFWKATVGFNERVTQLILCGQLRPCWGDKLAPAFFMHARRTLVCYIRLRIYLAYFNFNTTLYSYRLN